MKGQMILSTSLVCEFLVDEEGNLYDGEKKGTSIYNEK